MAHYAIGDVQGCFDELECFLNEIDFNPGKDTLWLTGDIVNREPNSLTSSRFIKNNEHCIQIVLGNHKLHLLAVAFDNGKIKPNDTIEDRLNAPDRQILLDWLRHQPLIQQRENYLMVHAGLLPKWSTKMALALSYEVEQQLQAAHFKKTFCNIYGNIPDQYQASLSGIDRIRLILNVMTRICTITTKEFKLNLNYKGSVQDMSAGLIPWFKAEKKAYDDHTIVFGHWSTLGLHLKDNVIGFDTSAIWGCLTAINLDNQEISQIKSKMKKNFNQQYKGCFNESNKNRRRFTWTTRNTG